jgi:hypothetical protein
MQSPERCRRACTRRRCGGHADLTANAVLGREPGIGDGGDGVDHPRRPARQWRGSHPFGVGSGQGATGQGQVLDSEVLEHRAGCRMRPRYLWAGRSRLALWAGRSSRSFGSLGASKPFPIPAQGVLALAAPALIIDDLLVPELRLMHAWMAGPPSVADTAAHAMPPVTALATIAATAGARPVADGDRGFRHRGERLLPCGWLRMSLLKPLVRPWRSASGCSVSLP